jgi:O-antigen ligase
MKKSPTGAILFIGAIALLAASFAFMAVQSSNLATALFFVTYVAVLFFVSPFVGLVIYIVFNYWPPQVFLPTLVSFRIMLITGGGTFLVMLFRQIAGREQSRFFKSPQDILVVLFAVAILVSHMAHADPSSAATALWGFSSVLIVYFLTTNLVTTDKRLNTILVVMSLCTLALAIQAVYQNVTGTAMVEHGLVEAERSFGAGKFENPNMLAIAILCITPFAFLATRGARARVVRVFWVAASAVLVVGLYLTNSRGGILTFAAIAGLLLVKKFGVWKGAAAGFLLGVGAFLFGPSRMSTISLEEASAFQRMVTWQDGIAQFLASPLFGIGADAWGDKVNRMIPHNSFIHCAAELGLLGLLPWVLLIYLSLRNTLFVSKDERSAELPLFRRCSEALFFALVGFVIASMFISKPYHPLLFILVGLSVSATNMFVETDTRSFKLFERRDLVIAILSTIVVLVVFIAFLKLAGF